MSSVYNLRSLVALKNGPVDVACYAFHSFVIRLKQNAWRLLWLILNESKPAKDKDKKSRWWLLASWKNSIRVLILYKSKWLMLSFISWIKLISPHFVESGNGVVSSVVFFYLSCVNNRLQFLSALISCLEGQLGLTGKALTAQGIQQFW